jgi:hypothetical protein
MQMRFPAVKTNVRSRTHAGFFQRFRRRYAIHATEGTHQLPHAWPTNPLCTPKLEVISRALKRSLKN